MSGDWTQYFKHKTATIDGKNVEYYVYKDKNVKTLPANLPMPPTDTFYRMFYNCNQLQDISALANWDVSNVKSMSSAFCWCYQLQGITALANWDVSNVENMGYMFESCYKLQDISALANWDVSSVKDMGFMFEGCYKLQDISALANWDVSNVENMYDIFYNCNQLQDISALANWNVSKVENMSNMFFNCHQLNISNETNNIKSYLRNLPKRSYPKQDHDSLLNSLWERVKPLLKDTTRLNNYFKRYTIKAPVKVSVKTEPVKETIDVLKPNTLTIDLPSDWQSIELPQWNP